MNVLFLLGNGFDLQLGLDTRYKDFYGYYKKLPSEDELIANMKKNLNNYLDGKRNDLIDVNWEDLELALGQYTAVINSYEELKTVYLDINKELMKYLMGQQQRFDRTDKMLEKLRDDFSQPERYLSTNDKRRYLNLLDGNTNLFIYTFNYTNCCEVIFDKHAPSPNANNGSTNLSPIQHIHGDLEMLNVLMGVNDESQIANESLVQDNRVKRMLIKPSTNNMLDNQKSKELMSVIDNMKVIVIYGASLGESDKIWRQKLAQRLKSESCYFLINEYQEGFDNIYDQSEVEEKAKADFIRKLGLGEEVEKYSPYVFVAVTKKMFGYEMIGRKFSGANRG